MIKECMHGLPLNSGCFGCAEKTALKFELADILSVLRAHGVTKFKGHGVEVELTPPWSSQARALLADEPLAPKTEAIGEAAGKPTDDEMLFWSAGGIDIKSDKPEE